MRIMMIYQRFIESCLCERIYPHSMLDLHKDKNDLIYKKTRETLPTTMLESLVIQNNNVTVAYMKTISDMKCQLHQFHFEKIIIQEKWKTIANIYVPLLQLRYNHLKYITGQHSMLSTVDNNIISIHNYYQ